MSVVELRTGFPVAGNKYLLGEQIGNGNHAVVRRAVRRDSKEEVALKITTRRKLNELAAHEIGIHSNLNHPNILAYRSHGRTESCLIYMELDLARTSMAELLREDGPPDIEVAVPMLHDVATGLDYLHDQIIHRDIKPANLLVINDQNQVVIADFGIAMHTPTDPFFTTDNDNYGSAAYAAPERVQNPPRATPGSDVYSMAAVAFEVLTGQRPFPQSDVEALAHHHINTPPPSFESVVGNGMMTHTLGELEGVVTEGLEKDDQKRPSAGQFGENLITVYYRARAEEAKGRTYHDQGRVTPSLVPSPPEQGTSRLSQRFTVVENTRPLSVPA